MRTALADLAAEHDLPFVAPPLALCTDNAAMIAAAAWHKLESKESEYDGLTAQPSLRLGE